MPRASSRDRARRARRAVAPGGMADDEVRRRDVPPRPVASSRRRVVASSAADDFVRPFFEPARVPRPPDDPALPNTPSPPRQYEDDFESDENDDGSSEDEYEDDFEDDVPATPRNAAPAGFEDPEDLARRDDARRRDEYHAARPPAPATPAIHPARGFSFGDECAAMNRAYRRRRARRVGERASTSASSEATGTTTAARHPTRPTDARRRIKRFALIARAVKLTHEDAACAAESIVDVAPMDARTMHLRGIGSSAGSNAKLATTQTRGGDDVREFTTQTELGDRRDVVSQCPEDLGTSRERCEAMRGVAGVDSREERRATAARTATRWARATGDLQHSKDRRLSAFIARAGACADVLLRERRVASGATCGVMRRANGEMKPNAVKGAAGSLTAGYVALHDDALTRNRRVMATAFAPSGTRTGAASLLIAYGPSDARAHGVEGDGLLLVWDLAAAATPRPSAAMRCEGTPTCVAWGPGRARALAFCGTEDGALCAWDLRELEDHHRAGGGGGEAGSADESEKFPVLRGGAIRRPSYCTEAHSATFPEDGGSIVSVGVAMDAIGDDDATGTGDDARGKTSEFHVVAVDCWGVANSYLVSTLTKREAADAALSDMGMRFGSRVRLVRASSELRYGGEGDRGGSGGQRVRDAVVVNRAGLASEFFVATESGRVLRGARYGVAPLPRAFALCDPLEPGRGAAVAPMNAAVSISFNPVFERAFLAAHVNGSIGLYVDARGSLALRRWDGVTGGEIVCVRWSLARPSMFFVLDSLCYVHVFDVLTRATNDPIHVECFGKVERIVSLELAAAGDDDGDGGSGKQYLASLAYDDGRTDVHEISAEFKRCTREEMDATRALLT